MKNGPSSSLMKYYISWKDKKENYILYNTNINYNQKTKESFEYCRCRRQFCRLFS